MTQFDYDAICASLRHGVPALAESLISALNAVLNDNKRLQNELSKVEVKKNVTKKENN